MFQTVLEGFFRGGEHGHAGEAEAVRDPEIGLPYAPMRRLRGTWRSSCVSRPAGLLPPRMSC